MILQSQSHLLRPVKYSPYVATLRLRFLLCVYFACTVLSASQIWIKLFLMLVFPFVRISARINNHAEIRTKGNTNIKNSLIYICDTDRNRADKVRRIKYTHKRKRSLRMAEILHHPFPDHIKQ